MADFNFLPIATDAWLADTAHLGRAERGLYMDLLILMWRSPECRVPNEIPWLERRLNLAENEVPIMRAIIAEFCHSTGNWLVQKRLKKERDFVAEKSAKARELAKRRWDKRKKPCDGNADPQCVGNAPTPTPTPTLLPLDKSNGAAVDYDPEKAMFDGGIALLGQAGKTAANARAILGKWKRDHGAEQVIVAIGRAKREGAIDPVSFIEGCFRAKRQASNLPSLHDVAPLC